MHNITHSTRTILTLPFDRSSPRAAAKSRPVATLSSRELQQIVADILG
ncbi:hypothetical protein PX699_03260 [Sphingobium sp. H39-3-25]|nr:hypothetical protein [Sphingobium arseniciresistens]